MERGPGNGCCPSCGKDHMVWSRDSSAFAGNEFPGWRRPYFYVCLDCGMRGPEAKSKRIARFMALRLYRLARDGAAMRATANQGCQREIRNARKKGRR